MLQKIHLSKKLSLLPASDKKIKMFFFLLEKLSHIDSVVFFSSPFFSPIWATHTTSSKAEVGKEE